MYEGGRDTRRRRLLRMAVAAVAEAVAWRLVARWCGHRLKGRSGEGGDDGDGDGGGEAATGRTIMDEAASVPVFRRLRARGGRATRAHDEESFRNFDHRYAPELLRCRHPNRLEL